MADGMGASGRSRLGRANREKNRIGEELDRACKELSSYSSGKNGTVCVSEIIQPCPRCRNSSVKGGKQKERTWVKRRGTLRGGGGGKRNLQLGQTKESKEKQTAESKMDLAAKIRCTSTDAKSCIGGGSVHERRGGHRKGGRREKTQRRFPSWNNIV